MDDRAEKNGFLVNSVAIGAVPNGRKALLDGMDCSKSLKDLNKREMNYRNKSIFDRQKPTKHGHPRVGDTSDRIVIINLKIRLFGNFGLASCRPAFRAVRHRVGGQRGCREAPFLPPPSEPDGKLSLHPALQ